MEARDQAKRDPGPRARSDRAAGRRQRDPLRTEAEHRSRRFAPDRPRRTRRPRPRGIPRAAARDGPGQPHARASDRQRRGGTRARPERLSQRACHADRAPSPGGRGADLGRDAARAGRTRPRADARAARGLVLLRAHGTNLWDRDRRRDADDRGHCHERGGVAPARGPSPLASPPVRADEPHRRGRDRRVRAVDLPGRSLQARHRAVAAAGLPGPIGAGRKRAPVSAGDELGRLATEAHRPELGDLDLRSTGELVALMNEADSTVAAAVAGSAAELAGAIDAIAARLRLGGRLIYVGAGTSGRIAALDAEEVGPTFSVPAGQVVALTTVADAAEDDAVAGSTAVSSADVEERDAVVAVSASGRTPYTLAAVLEARSRGALTVAVVCVADSELARACEQVVTAEVGPELVAGSTRLKAGTAQKLIL